jgi:beta-fructofuranosidase
MGEWWYLIYSEQHDAIRKVQYFKGRTLDELKACTANDAGLWPDSHEGFLDSRGLYAGKTASNGTDRYIWGWCATRSGDSNLGSNDWAGNLVAHKLIQHEDGTLTLGEVPAIANKFGQGNALDSFSLSGDSYKLMGRLGYTNRISFTVTLDNPADKFGISLARGGDSSAYYTLVVNPEGETNRKINFEEEGTDGSGFIANADSYLFAAPTDGVYNITMVTDNSVVTFYINDVLAYTNRVYGLARNCWSINTYGGSLSVTNLRLATL